MLLHLCQCEAEMGGFKKYIFGDVVLSVIGLGGAKKRRSGIATRRFHRNIGEETGNFFSILLAHRLSILQGYPFKHFP